MEIKKTLLWVVFSVSGILLLNNWQISQGQPPLPFLAQPTNQNTTKEEVVNRGSQMPTPVSKSPIAVAAPSDGGLKATEKTDTVRIELKNDVLDLVLSNRGGTIVSAALRKHFNDGKPVTLFAVDQNSTYFARNGLIAEGIDAPNHNDIFRHQISANGQKITFTLEKNGILLEKSYALIPDSYVVETTYQVTNKTNKTVTPSLYLELVRDNQSIDESQFYSTFTGPAIYREKEKFQEISFVDIEKNKVKPMSALSKGENGWIAMVQHYFASAWIPQTEFVREFYFDKLEKNLYRIGIKSGFNEIAPNGSAAQSAKLFIGPEDEKILKLISPEFELIKDYGMLTIIAKPIFWLLTQIHSIVNNWGWAIVILTILIKIVFFPLSAASYKSMARMKEVQPKLVQMKEQYKNDPQKLNAAMMEMYKKEKINPLGGCLPVLIQIPVFISLYWVLLLSVEMRGAPWIGWIYDLSKPETSISDLIGISIPIGVLPILMAISMYIQVKLNPTPPDPIQAKVMLYMPLIFSLMFFFFPSGLVLYYIVNNILSIAQQWQINNMFATKKA
jgi:YidC/Oxa1 family membrane protein insertase